MGRKTKIVLGVGAVLLGATAAFFAYVAQHKVGPAAVPVERETTYLTEPLDANGRVDYLAYLNAGQLPPPQENAAIVLLEILGTQALVGDVDGALKALGAPKDLPREGLHVRKPKGAPDLADWDAFEGELGSGDLALVRGWIDDNAEALSRLPEVVARPHFAAPVPRDSELGLFSFAFDVPLLQSLYWALEARATLATHEGRLADAWRDLQLGLGLSRLYAQTPLMLPRLMASGLRYSALDWVRYVTGRGLLGRELAGEIRGTLEALPPLLGLDRAVIERERLAILAGCQHQVVRQIEAQGGDPNWDPANVALVAALRVINARFDEYEELLHPDLTESIRGMDAASDRMNRRMEDIKRHLESVTGKTELVVRELTGGGEECGRLLGEALAPMSLSLFPWVARKPLDAETQREFTLLALAIRAHERRTGSLPSTLDALAKDGQRAAWGSLDRESFEYDVHDNSVTLWYGELHLELASGS